MKLSPGGDSDLLSMPVESLLMNTWNPADIAASDVRHFLIGQGTKLSLGSETDDDEDVEDAAADITDDDRHHHHHHHPYHHRKATTLDDLDVLLTAAAGSTTAIVHHHHHHLHHGSTVVANNTLAELKPLPPFTGYTGHLSINGISGHHYHTIASAPSNSSRILIETNNNSVETTNQNILPYYQQQQQQCTTTTTTDHVVSSSTIEQTIDNIKAESMMDYSLATDMDEDIAAIIGSAMADTTVHSGNVNGDGEDSRDSWLDLDAWIGSACDAVSSVSPASSIPPLLPLSSQQTPLPIVNGAKSNNIVTVTTTTTINSNNNNNNNNNASSSSSRINTNLSADGIPAFVANSQFSVISSPPPAVPIHHSHNHHHQQHINSHHPVQHLKSQSINNNSNNNNNNNNIVSSLHQQRTDIGTFSPHMPLLQNRLQNGPPKQIEPSIPPTNSTTDITYNIVSDGPSSPSSSTQYLNSPPCHVVSTTDIGFIQVHSSTTGPSPELQVSFPHTTTPGKKSRSRSSKAAKSLTCGSSTSVLYNEGNLGKEKTVHRCNICNRGFLNKSNIKVHLRTHTGEKPFRCEICGKAFRQKAHLIKHAQIHKRIGRD